MVGTPASGGSISTPSASIMAGTEPREAMPICPQAVQSMAMPRVSGRHVRMELLILHSRSLAEE